MGDGFMTTFDHILNAISCAKEIQVEAKARKFDIPVRIGIHYGDITIDNEDIFGHGVNMASRIQAIADPGGIYISESIQELIGDRQGIETQFMGAVPLKNIKDQVPVYALKDEELPTPDKKRIDSIIRRQLYLKYYKYAAIAAVLIIAIAVVWFLRTFDIEREIITKSVAVIPLKNLSENPEQDFLSTSLTDELIRELSSISSIIDAVMCVLSIQKATEELEIPLRIAIHHGDMIYEKKDILGDGVNIDSRIHMISFPYHMNYIILPN
jgi:class 3 adenylate cyclase